MSGASSDNPLESLDVFWTELSPNRAVVYARLTDVEYRAGWRLSGAIRGPRSLRHQTLAATVPFKDLGPGPTHLARAVVPEPSYWSPESPNIYDVTIQLHRDGEPALVEKRMLGFKPIRAGERYFLREGKPWILRGVTLDQTQNFDLEAARGEKLVVTAERELWARASEEGLYLTALVSPSLGSVREQLRQCAQYPAVTFVTIPHNGSESEVIQKDGHNLVLLQALSSGNANEICGWADGVITGVWALDENPSIPNGISKPVCIGQPCDDPVDVQTARAQCDALQRRLAPRGQFAGYYVDNRE